MLTSSLDYDRRQGQAKQAAHVTGQQLRIAARQVWATIPLGMRFKIALMRMIASIQEGIAIGIVSVLADHDKPVPRKPNGDVNLRDPAIKELGVAIFKKILGVLGRSSDINDVMQSTFERVFLRDRKFQSLRGDTFKANRAWILTIFHNAAKDHARGLTVINRKLKDMEKKDPNEPNERQKAEMVKNQLQHRDRIPWENHPMWRQIKTDVFRVLDQFDEREQSGGGRKKKYDFPVRRVFELMLVEGMKSRETAVQLSKEGLAQGQDPEQVRHALNRFKKRLQKAIEETMKAIEDSEMMESFYDAIDGVQPSTRRF